MTITLTCPCGRKTSLARAAGGEKVICRACGQTLVVPAMGILESKKSVPAAAAPSRVPNPVRLALTAIGLTILTSAGFGWAVWFAARETPRPFEVVEQAYVEPKPNAPAAPKHGDSGQDSPKLPAETHVSPKPIDQVIEPVRPSSRPAIAEPIAQVGALPNPFLLPKLPDPPKVVEKKPNVMEPLKLVWKLKEGDVFYQELVVLQKPTFKVQGIPIASLLQYRIVSRFTVKKANDDGSLIVEQKVESAKLLQADELTKAAVGGAVGQMPGTTYAVHLNAKMDVTKFEGAVGGPKVAALGGMGMQMTSLLDRDGWKELAQATFFQMDKPLKVKDRWSKAMTHNWGALGAWSGQIHYLYFGKQDALHRIGYSMVLAYQAPRPGAVGLMKINGATFQQPLTEGVLLFDANKGKVVAAEERFRVKGLLNVSLLGQNTQIEIDEDQHFLIRIHEKLPQ